MPLKYYMVTLGCPKNTVDSNQMSGFLLREGFLPTKDLAEAQIIIINTCGFIEEAKRESIETILEMSQWKEKGNLEYLVVVGCLVQKYADELSKELPEIDLFLGTGDIDKLPLYIKELSNGNRIKVVSNPDNYLFCDDLPILDMEIKHYAYIKIAEGCDNSCTYCVIPQMRGHYRSRTMESILKEVNDLVKIGVKEIILVAQDTTLYGLDLYGEYKLPELLRCLASIEELHWIKILYCYPDFINDELIRTIKTEDKVCSYIDLPLQHISDDVLKAMGRAMTKEQITQLLCKIKNEIPEVVIRTTFILGFPGETQEHILELERFLKDMQLDRAGFFTYSREPDTIAASLPNQIEESEKFKRQAQLISVQEDIMYEKLAVKIGQSVEIIVDGPSQDSHNYWEGRTYGDAPEIDCVVYFCPNKNTKIGDFLYIKVTHSQEFALIGEITDEPGQ